MTKRIRLDIQSLRGIAILSVLLFHFFPEILPGGYLGVDIFFVISGFLITKIISNDLESDTFKFKVFYLKRFKRIAPLLVFIITVFSIVAILFLLPSDLKNYFQSLKYTLLLIPNFYFWMKGGYFGLIDELKPMLHLWSIGVEIQFYILFPIIYFFITKIFGKSKIVILIIILFFLSFLLNILLNFIGGANLSFFIFPTRLWEFLGGSLAYYTTNKKIELKMFFVTFFLFLLLFLYALVYNQAIFNQIFAVFLTFLTICFVDKEKKLNFVFQNKFLIFFGLISYSLYLWHWPILSFTKYYFIRELFFYEKIILLVLSITVSFISLKLIENKLRFNFSNFKNMVFISAGIIIILIMFFFEKNNFLPKNHNPIALNVSKSINTNFRCRLKQYVFYGSSKACIVNFSSAVKYDKDKDVFALYGNSHAQMYGYPFIKILKELDKSGIIIPLNGCLPTIDLNISVSCLKKANKNFNKLIKDKNINTVLLGFTWNHDHLVSEKGNSIKLDNGDHLVTSINKLIQKLHDKEKKVILIGPISLPSYAFALDYSRKIHFNRNLKLNTYNEYESFIKKNNLILNSFKNTENFYFVEPHTVQCANFNRCNFLIKNQSVFSDSSHLSKFGSNLMEDIFREAILSFD